jgi:hypothetical protein
MLTLQTEEVTLNDGRKVLVSETTGLDEMIGAQIVGDDMNPMKPGASALMMRSVFTVLSIKEIDGKKVDRPTNLPQIQSFMANFTSKQLSKIGAAYSRLNDDMDAMNPNAVKPLESKN